VEIGLLKKIDKLIIYNK